MTFDALIALIGFAVATSITPGPNNLMLMASGANFGYRRSIPHMLGISLGHMLMIVLVGLGLIGLFELFPVLDTVMKVLSVTYLLFLAWKTANAAPPAEGAAAGTPLTFLQAAAFQWVNPKAWFMALTAITVYSHDRTLPGVVLVAAIFSASNLARSSRSRSAFFWARPTKSSRSISSPSIVVGYFFPLSASTAAAAAS